MWHGEVIHVCNYLNSPKQSIVFVTLLIIKDHHLPILIIEVVTSSQLFEWIFKSNIILSKYSYFSVLSFLKPSHNSIGVELFQFRMLSEIGSRVEPFLCVLFCSCFLNKSNWNIGFLFHIRIWNKGIYFNNSDWDIEALWIHGLTRIW